MEVTKPSTRSGTSAHCPGIQKRWRITRPGKFGQGSSRGTRILRTWHGETHEIAATDSGYEYCGAVYASLSQIARKITTAPSGLVLPSSS